ncbi:PRPF39 [Cordylochernes scorpioides]|uniref:PRPF39 n=1 Tax=Cordylochernes scorpioides TaxID=51811 RepID=A0ABY6LGX7_9ARAC|nr:PRPF39 [Cordylochernes scorpioides]
MSSEPKMHPENDDKENKDPKEPTELEKYWQNVRENPTDFIGWTYLLQYVEQENNMENAREAFDSFFQYYPYCYGYWKKYADMEKKHENIDKAEEVFERGVAAIPLSVDLWIHYINFCKNRYKDEPDCLEKLKTCSGASATPAATVHQPLDSPVELWLPGRSWVFERAAAAAGQEFRSDRLWDLYLSWETENHNLRGLLAIYDQLLAIPTQLYSHHYEKFQELVQKNSPQDLLSPEEYLQLKQEYAATRPEKMAEADVPPGLESEEKSEPTELKEKLLESRTAIFKKNEEEVQKRWTFEEGIKRPYFHVKPLERAQLRNWREYLDYEIQNSKHERVMVLFERCLIACALYEDLWLKYARYMEPHGSDGVRDVYRRACTIHLIKKPNINMMWAAYEEKSGNYEEAERILEQLVATMPDLLEASLRRINMKRRRGLHEEAEALYKEAIEKAKTVRIASHLAVKYARLLYKVVGDCQKALQVVREALDKDSARVCAGAGPMLRFAPFPLRLFTWPRPRRSDGAMCAQSNHHLYMQLVDIYYQQQPLDVEAIAAIFESALSSELSADHKLTMSQRKLEFLEDFGSDPYKVQEALDEYAKLLKSHLASKKRTYEETGEEANKEKKAKVEVNGTTTTVAATDPAYTYSQSWPAASYAQGAYAGYPQGWSGGYQASYYPTQ